MAPDFSPGFSGPQGCALKADFLPPCLPSSQHSVGLEVEQWGFRGTIPAVAILAWVSHSELTTGWGEEDMQSPAP